MGIWSTVDINYLSTLEALRTHLDSLYLIEHMVHSLPAQCINFNGGDAFVENVKQDLEEYSSICINTVVVEQASHRHERELERVLARLSTTVLGIRPNQIIHVYILSPENFKEYNNDTGGKWFGVNLKQSSWKRKHNEPL